jgi:biotin carboxyl carrier protein
VVEAAGLVMKIAARVGEHAFEVTVSRQNGKLLVEIDGQERLVDARKLEADFYSILVDGKSYEVSVETRGSAFHVRHGAAERVVELSDPSRGARQELRSTAGGAENVVSVMPGKVVRVLVAAGDRVERGAGLVVIEAMKMENEIASPKAGLVSAVHVEPGKTVESGATLVVIDG